MRVFENGEPREVAGFERDERPLAAYLVLDTSAGAARVFRTQAFDSVWTFVSSLPKDARCTLFSTGERPRKLGGRVVAVQVARPLHLVELDALHLRLAALVEIALEDRGDALEVARGDGRTLRRRRRGGAPRDQCCDDDRQ